MLQNRKIRSFFRRVKDKKVLTALYLSWHYTYLGFYDFKNKTSFSNSQTAAEGGVPMGGTGNFPAQPMLVRKYLKAADLKKDDQILDVGHGSGIVLHVAQQMGFVNLSGVEYSSIAYSLSQRNLGKSITLIHGDAVELDLSKYQSIFFFSPFRGTLAKQFFEKVVASPVKVVVTVNHDPIIDPILCLQYKVTYRYQHFIYKNFNCKIWVRK